MSHSGRCSGSSVRDARLHFLPELAQCAQVLSRQTADEPRADAGQVGSAGLVEEHPALVGNRGEVAAGILLTALALEQTVALESIHESCKSAAAEENGVGELRHSHPPVGRVREVEQNFVRGKRKAVEAGELRVELMRHVGVDAQHPAPCGELVAIELMR
jgi:hypothetical protein